MKKAAKRRTKTMNKTKNIVKILVKIWKSLVHFFKFDDKILSEIETVASENAYFWGGFSDARICVEINFFS